MFATTFAFTTLIDRVLSISAPTLAVIVAAILQNRTAKRNAAKTAKANEALMLKSAQAQAQTLEMKQLAEAAVGEAAKQASLLQKVAGQSSVKLDEIHGMVNGNLSDARAEAAGLRRELRAIKKELAGLKTRRKRRAA